MGARAGRTTQATSTIASRATDQAGFALYELILALAIISLVAAVVFPRVVRAPGAADLRANAQEIAALLRTDRNAALRRGREIVSEVDLDSGVITSGSAAGSVTVPRGVKMQFIQSSRELRADGGGIRFRPDGRSSGGVLYLVRRDTAYQISVNWLTSGVLVARGPAPARSGG